MVAKLQATGSQTPTCPCCLHPGILAQPLCLLVGHIDVVEATEKGSQDDHEDEHEPGKGWDEGGSGKSPPWEIGGRRMGLVTFQAQPLYLTSI